MLEFREEIGLLTYASETQESKAKVGKRQFVTSINIGFEV